MSTSEEDRRYFGIKLEEISSQNKLILEAVGAMQVHVAKIPGMQEDITELKQDGKIIKAAVTGHSAELHDQNLRLTRLEADAA